MGLAASQARLLTITARKADCEFESMVLSHQKLSLARDMENVSTEYQNALSQTKLVYDYYGTGDTSINLNYGLLMTPSVYNDYYPMTVTDSDNRVILNSSYAAAARAAGIPVEGLEGTPSDSVRNSFIEALAGAGVITASRAASIESVTYGNTIGLGSTTNATTAYTQISYDTLLEMIEANTSDLDLATYGLNLTITEAEAKSNTSGFGLFGSNGACVREYNSKGGFVTEVGINDADPKITLSDLLSNDTQYVWTFIAEKGACTPATELAYMQGAICGTESNSQSFVQYLIDQFTTVLGGVAQNETAMQYAANAVYNIVYPNNQIQDAVAELLKENPAYVTGDEEDRKHGGGRERDGEFREKLVSAAAAEPYWKHKKNTKDEVSQRAVSKIGLYYSQCADAGSTKQKHSAAINLNNLAQVFVTAMVDYLEENESNYTYEKGEKGNSRLYNSEKDDYQFTIAVQTEVDSDDDNLYANFYDALFNQICTNGWTENDQVEDTDYLTDLFKNSLAYISTIAEDGYYYQGSYSSNTKVLEVSDESAIAVAEAKYNTEKTKIENKEDTIDLKMKNLDTEISSLTTEYDSTKQIISKSVEKSFKRYDA